MRKINLLYVITKLELGGAQQQLLSLIRFLDREKFNIFLFTAQNGLLTQEAAAINGLSLKKSKFLERPINPLKDLLALFEIYWFIKKNKIDIAHTHSSKAGILGRWAARLAGVKFILHTVHGWSFHDYQSGLVRAFYLWLERVAARFSDKIIVVSEHDRQKGIKNAIGSHDKYRLIRYGINYTDFNVKDSGIRKELGINDNDLAVGMIGCLKPQKSPQDFIKLASLVNQGLPNTKFILVGDGILRKNLEKMIKQFNLGNQVILTGWRRDILRILSALDVFVLTSLWEGLPISVLEAMAASIPVIATDTGGISEVIREGKTGFLVEPGDTHKMAEKLMMFLKDKAFRIKIATDAKQALTIDVTFNDTFKKTQDLYLEKTHL